MDRRQDNAAHLCVVSHTGGKYRKWRQNDSKVKVVILSHTGSIRPHKTFQTHKRKKRLPRTDLGVGGVALEWVLVAKKHLTQFTLHHVTAEELGSEMSSE